MRFPPSFLDDIRGRVSISSVVGRRVAWDRRKTNVGKGDYWACCPFHNEKSPSFHVDDRKGWYHCFGCKVSGDIFKFLVGTEGIHLLRSVVAKILCVIRNIAKVLSIHFDQHLY